MPLSVLIEQLTLPLRFPDEEDLNAFFGALNKRFVHLARASLFKKRAETFYVYADPGLGKTHFLKGICIEGLKLGKTCAYIPLKERKNIDITALDELEYYDILVLDDLQVVEGDLGWQTALFHLYNRIWARDKTKLFVAATQLPANLDFNLPDLISRLYGGHLHALMPLSVSEVLETLQHRAQVGGLKLSDQSCRFFIKNFYPDQKKLFEEWKKLDDASFQTKHRITIPFIKKTFSSL